MNGYFKNVTADDIDAIVSYIQDCIGKAIRTTCRRPVWTSNEWRLIFTSMSTCRTSVDS